MEYLTLHDIPHRYHDQLHSQRMTSSHSSERPLAHMAAAVSGAQDSFLSLDPSLRAYSLPATVTNAPPKHLYPCPWRWENDRKRRKDIFRRQTAPARTTNAPVLEHIHLPILIGAVSGPRRTGAVPEPHQSTLAPAEHSQAREKIQHPLAHPVEMPFRPLLPHELHGVAHTTDAVHNPHKDTRSYSQIERQQNILPDSTLTLDQQHHMRSSPPIQPGEQNHAAKLPSFSEFLHTTRAETPPRTPSHRNGSVENSPRARPLFDDVAWNGDYPRKRNDTLGDIYAHQMTDPRRMSSAIDPSLVYGSPLRSQHATMQSVASEQHNRPIHSYPLPPSMHASAPSSVHARQQSSPVASSGAPYSQQSALHGLASQAAYRRPSLQNEAIYEQQRSNYYQEHRAPGYAYNGGQDYHYAGPSYPAAPHPGYEVAYGDIRFQQHVGTDHNAFNRKRRGNLPKEATNILKEWFAANRSSPYPTEDQKINLCNRTNLSLNQVSNWFINARRRAPQKEQRDRQVNDPSA